MVALYFLFKRLESTTVASASSIALPPKSLSATFTIGTAYATLHCLIEGLPVIVYSTGERTLYTASCPSFNYFIFLGLQELFIVLSLLFSVLPLFYGLLTKQPLFATMAILSTAAAFLGTIATISPGGCVASLTIQAVGAAIAIVFGLLTLKKGQVFPFARPQK